MNGLPLGGFHFVGGAGGGELRQPLQRWVYGHPHWAHTLSTAEACWRRSTAEEVAAQLVQDQALQEVLATLSSPLGQAIEQAALAQWMGPVDARLMTAALTQAFRLIRDQDVPIWKRGEVLVGVLLLVLVVGAVIVAKRRSADKQSDRSTRSKQRPQTNRRRTTSGHRHNQK
jgi:hypothetical protein